MAAEWYYAKGKQKHGPLTEAQLQELAASGELLPTDMAWKQGTKGWVEASTVPGLFPDDGPPPLGGAPAGENASPLHAVWNYSKSHPVLCTAGGLGVCFLLTLVVPNLLAMMGLDGLALLVGVPLLLVDFALLVLLVVLTVRSFRHYALLSGKWNPVDGKGESLEFSGLNTVTRGDSLAGTFVVHKDNRMEITSGGQVVEVWQLVKVDGSELVIQDASGSIRRFKKKSTNPLAALFESKRTNHLEGSWQPITESNEWLQFTKDGAVVFSDGSAGRFTVSGEEPNEVIDIELVSGSSRQFKIVSLTSAQLVIAEGNEATTFRRPKKAVKKRDKSAAATSDPQDVAATSDAQDVATNGGDLAESTPTSSKGIFGGLFSFFTKWKCPKCGQRSGEKTSTQRISDYEQQVMTTTDRNSPTFQVRQVVVNVWMVRHTYICKSCNHCWQEDEKKWSQA